MPHVPTPADLPHPLDATATGRAPALLRIERLGFAYPGDPAVLADFSATLHPGVTFLAGDTGCGKTTLLRLLAGELKGTGVIAWADAAGAAAPDLCWFDPRDPDFDNLSSAALRDWLQQRHPALDVEAWEAHVAAFGLTPHRDKPLYMLSTGSRRKAGLAAALSARCRLTLLDEPAAGLDGPSREHLRRCLAVAAQDAAHAVVLASSADLGDVPGAQVWQLGPDSGLQR